MNTFKMVCVENTGAAKLEIGKVYEGTGYPHEGHISIIDSYYTIPLCSKYFLRLPTEPKTCADMTMEEYLAMVCLASANHECVEVSLTHSSGWQPCRKPEMLPKGSEQCLYRIKPEKSAKDVEIERIEGAMRKLADDLAKIKGD